jgi:hypothetical protein
MPTTPNMGLNQTQAGVTPGPSYATQIDANTGIIDLHDHTSGKGKLITTPAISITADLAFNAHSILTALNITGTGKIFGNTLNDRFSIYSLSSAVGDGVTDDSAAFTTACTSVSSGGGGFLNLPSGTFFLNGNVTVPKNVVLQFQGGTIKMGTGKIMTVLQGFTAPPIQIFQFTSGDKAPIRFGSWTATGTPVTSGVPPYILPQWWGAKGDGATNDWEAFQQAVWSCGYSTVGTPQVGVGGIILVLQGNYQLNKSLVFNFGNSGMSMVGTSACAFTAPNNTNLAFTQTDGTSGIVCGPLSTDQVVSLRFENFSISNATTGGHNIDIPCATNITFQNIVTNQSNSAKSCLNADANASGGQIGSIRTRDCTFQLGNNYAAPAINLSAGTGLGLTDCSFTNTTINGKPVGGTAGTAPQIKLFDHGVTGVNLVNIKFETLRAEFPVAGILHNFGARNVRLSGCSDYDISPPSGNTAPLVKTALGGSSLTLPNGMIMENCFFSAGSNNTSTPSVQGFAIGNYEPFTLIGCQVAWLDSGTSGVGGPGPIGVSTTASGVTGQVPMFCLQQQAITGLSGLSATATPPAFTNLRGTLSFATSATATATFSTVEPDTNYFIELGAPQGAALPIAGSGRFQRIVKTTSGFTVTTEVASTQTQTVDWMLVR